MHKKELEELYYIFIDGLFASFPIDTKYCNDENSILPFSTVMTNMEEKGKCNRFYHHTALFIKSSSEQDSYLYSKNTLNWGKNEMIKHIKNYIHDKKYSYIFCKTLEQYLSNDYTFDTILKECLDIKGSAASKAKRDLIQHKPKMTYKRSTHSISFQQSLTTYDSFMVQYNSTAYPHSTSIPSISIGNAIKIDYTIPLIMLIPLFILFCCITSMVMKCCSYISKRRARDCRMADDGNKLLPSVSFSSESESVQFRSGKICDGEQF
ncbi:hypothetical protein [Candidatus Mesenet endosymbiont of Phosphuga atrata]|uniref:hypothetical protein n=1 Tax=Candidatus Mesenet endosymbiont of Phosphuga atrata TaxID=3066221 RepID=UPI0030CFD96B